MKTAYTRRQRKAVKKNIARDRNPGRTRNAGYAAVGVSAYLAASGRRSNLTRAAAGAYGIATAVRMSQAKKHGSYTKAHQKRMGVRANINRVGTPQGSRKRTARTRRNYKGQFAGSY